MISTLPALAAGTRTITGTVYENDNKEVTAIGALVYRDGVTAFATETDTDGRFVLKDIPDTYESLTVDLMGFEKYTIDLNPDQENYEIVLKPSVDYTIDAAINSQCSDKSYPEKHITKCTFGPNMGGENCDCCTNVVCESGRYAPTKDENGCAICQDLQGTKCDTTPAHATASSKLWTGTKLVCNVQTCESTRYKVANYDDRDGECTDLVNTSCLPKDTDDARRTNDPNARHAYFRLNSAGTDIVCQIEDCSGKYIPSDDKTTCETGNGPCDPTKKNTKHYIEHATAGQLRRGVCNATDCEPGFDPIGGSCVDASGKACDKDKLPANAKSGTRQLRNGVEVCVVTDADCADGFKASGDGLSCVSELTKEESAERVKKLQDNYDAMQDKEMSLANRITGAAGIGAVGIGGMQLASALSEQKSDADAERDMAAYLATFRCSWGSGQSANGGDTDVNIGGAGQITNLYREYMNLAADLKARKESLELPAGIESEVILNSANTGLYDDVSVGKTDGAFTSVARALSDKTSEDAAEWSAQQDASAQKLKTGATIAGVGAVGSLAANVIVNKKSATEQSDKILQEYKK